MTGKPDVFERIGMVTANIVAPSDSIPDSLEKVLTDIREDVVVTLI